MKVVLPVVDNHLKQLSIVVMTMMLSMCIIRKIFEYIHQDYHYIICKNDINNSNSKLLPISIIFNSKLHQYFKDVLLSPSFSPTTIINSIVNNHHYDALKWLLCCDQSHRYINHIDNIILNACNNGDLMLLISLKEIGMLRFDNVMYSYWSSSNGRINILMFLHENGMKFDAWTCTMAAMEGHLDVLMYLRSLVTDDDEMYWNSTTTAAASYSNHLEMLQYLHLRGCSWDFNAHRLSIDAQNQRISQYLIDNGCPQWSVFE